MALSTQSSAAASVPSWCLLTANSRFSLKMCGKRLITERVFLNQMPPTTTRIVLERYSLDRDRSFTQSHTQRHTQTRPLCVSNLNQDGIPKVTLGLWDAAKALKVEGARDGIEARDPWRRSKIESQRKNIFFKNVFLAPWGKRGSLSLSLAAPFFFFKRKKRVSSSPSSYFSKNAVKVPSVPGPASKNESEASDAPFFEESSACRRAANVRQYGSFIASYL